MANEISGNASRRSFDSNELHTLELSCYTWEQTVEKIVEDCRFVFSMLPLAVQSAVEIGGRNWVGRWMKYRKD